MTRRHFIKVAQKIPGGGKNFPSLIFQAQICCCFSWRDEERENVILNHSKFLGIWFRNCPEWKKVPCGKLLIAAPSSNCCRCKWFRTSFLRITTPRPKSSAFDFWPELFFQKFSPFTFYVLKSERFTLQSGATFANQKKFCYVDLNFFLRS